MVSNFDAADLDAAINAMLGSHPRALTEANIQWMAEALGLIFSRYTVSEIASIIVRTAANRDEFSVTGRFLDS